MGRVLRLAAILVLVLAPVAGRADETPAGLLYYRDNADPGAVVGLLRNLAIRRRADSVLVVFDAATFAPPPGDNEFTAAHVYARDVPAWLDALEALEPPGEARVFAATTLAGRALALREDGWRASLETLLRLPWWERKDLREFPPATAWIARLLGSVPGPRRMLVLVTGEILPEAWADHDRGGPEVAAWRRKLPEPGGYWDEERVAAAVRAAGATLDVVAPEARFGDFLPTTDIPELPFVSRPRVPVMLDPTDPAIEAAVPTLEELLASLRRAFPDMPDEELAALARACLENWEKYKRAVAGAEPVFRFDSLTPWFFDHYGSYTFFHNDVPSRFGYWPFARAAAATGGHYLFYPFPRVDFLDDCPYDPILLAALAPDYDRPAEAVAAARAGDAALDALCRAAKKVLPATPWSDAFAWNGGRPRATGWFGYASARPLVFERRHRERCKPYEDLGLRYGKATSREWKVEGERIGAAVERYDEAIAILDDAARRIDSGADPVPIRRSMANLRLARFWFEASAFHLAALSLFYAEIERHAPPEVVRGEKPVWLLYDPTIRMSDCLAGYEGVTIPEEEDLRLQFRVPPKGREKTQSNLLPLPFDDARYRALRHPRQVLKRLDPRLLGRALRLIDAGDAVMRHEGRSPWGWMVYYSDAVTFLHFPVVGFDLPTDEPGVDPAPAGRPTPHPRGPATGGTK